MSFAAGYARDILGSALGDVYNSGYIIHVKKEVLDNGDYSVLDTYTVRAKYQFASRQYVDGGGVQQNQPTIRVLQNQLNSEFEVLGLVSFVKKTDDLDAQFIDASGNRYEIMRSDAPEGSTYWVFDIKLIQGGGNTGEAVAQSYVDDTGEDYTDDLGEVYSFA